METVLAIWQLVLGQFEPFKELVEGFCGFAEMRRAKGDSGFRGVSKDVWTMFVEFLETVKLGEKDGKKVLEGYDENSAWPAVIDEYAEFLSNGEQI